jgi:hypothetical protein
MMRIAGNGAGMILPPTEEVIIFDLASVGELSETIRQQGESTMRFHTPFNAATVGGDGLLTVGDTNACVVSGANEIVGISIEGWQPGDIFWLRAEVPMSFTTDVVCVVH